MTTYTKILILESNSAYSLQNTGFCDLSIDKLGRSRHEIALEIIVGLPTESQRGRNEMRDPYGCYST